MIIISGPVLLFFYARQVEPNLLMVHQQKVVIKNLPKELAGLRIVQISDLHGKEFTGDKLVEKVNRLRPDILVITGDVLDGLHPQYEYIERVLGPMQARLGKFYVSGNNEYSANLSWGEMEKAYQQAKVTVLHNQSCRINFKGKYLWLVGIDDPSTGHDRLDLALQGTGQATKILLAHSPEIINQAEAKKIELVLVGHTHGGQIRIPGLARRPELKYKVERIFEKANHVVNRILNYIRAHTDELNQINITNTRLPEIRQSEIRLPKADLMFTLNMKPGFEKYVAGFYQVGDTRMYVNRGLGETWIPFRLFSPPEITEFQLVRE